MAVTSTKTVISQGRATEPRGDSPDPHTHESISGGDTASHHPGKETRDCTAAKRD